MSEFMDMREDEVIIVHRGKKCEVDQVCVR